MRRFFLEFDDARSGGFAPLRFVPKGKQVVLGLGTTKSGTLEDKDVLKLRIDEAAQYVPLDQLCLSPQCGFSSTVEGNALSIDEGKAKLTLIVETAAEVWADALCVNKYPRWAFFTHGASASEPSEPAVPGRR